MDKLSVGRMLGVVLVCVSAGILGLTFWIPLLPAHAQAPAADQRDYSLGLAAYQKGNYQKAIEYFKASLANDSNSPTRCIRRLYLGHSYAAIKELGKAIRTYREIESICWGSPEAKLATECIEKLSNPETARAIASTTTRPQPVRSMLSRIKVLPAHSSKVPISPDFISMVKSTVTGFRSDLYQVLDKGGCTITVAQCISDKWPDTKDYSKQNNEHLKLSSDYGQTQARDIFIWERPIFPDKTLGDPFPTWCCQSFLRTQLGRVACHIQGLDTDKEYLAEYKKDVDKLTTEDKQRDVKFITSLNQDGSAQLAGYIVENYLTAEIDPEMSKFFPHSYAWIKRRLKL